MMKSEKVAIVGTDGFAREVLWLIQENNFFYNPGLHRDSKPFNIVGFLTDDGTEHGKTVCDLPVLGAPDWLLDHQDVSAVCAITAPRTRIGVVRLLEKNSVRFATVIHPSVKMSQFVEIGAGSIVCAGTIITTQVKIGRHVHINLDVTIGHDVVIEDYVTVAPGVNISGSVQVQYGAELGTNCSVLQGLKIGEGAVVGAGAVVTEDVEPNMVYAGVPARPLKEVPVIKRDRST